MFKSSPLPRILRRALLTLAISPLAAGAASAQSATATISGIVVNQRQAVIAGASVTAVNEATRLARKATCSDEGYFTIALLPPGNYTLTVERDGFAQARISNVVLNVDDRRTLQIELKIGAITDVVTVDGASLINESPAVGTVIDRQFVGNLPLNGRSFQSLILLTPGVVATTAVHDNPGEFSVNGQRATSNYFTVDGVSANTGATIADVRGQFGHQLAGALPGGTALGTTASLVSIDALEEFKIQTSTYTSELGRQPGGQIQLVTRSGGNQFKGLLFNYLRNDALDARNWFNKEPDPQPALRQNQFGGTFSGPVLIPRVYNGRDRTFFFFSYEGQRLRQPQVLSSENLVPAVWLREAAHPNIKPFLDAYPLPNGDELPVLQNQTRPHQPDPEQPNYNPFVPSGFASFTGAYSDPASVDAYGLRLDHIVNNRLTLFGRYARTPSNSLRRRMNLLDGGIADSRSLTLGATFSATPRLNNEFKINYTRNKASGSSSLDDFGGASPVTISQMAPQYTGPGPVFACFTFNSSYCLGNFSANFQRQLNIVDNLSWVMGSHQWKFGIDWRRLTPIYGPEAYNASATLNMGFPTPTHIGRVMAGAVDRALIFANQGARPIFDNFSAYVQDTWKLSSRLTLDMGIRWELNPPPHDANGVTPVIITGINDPDVSGATVAPPGTPFYKTIYTAFAPRVGAAYQLRRNSGWETVLRGGFGMYYDLGSNTATDGFSLYPFRAFKSLFNPVAGIPYPLTPEDATPPEFPEVTPTTIPSGAFGLNPDLKLPYTLQWSVALEQALGSRQTVTLSYVASAGRRLTVTSLLNQAPFSGFLGDPRPNPNFQDIFYSRNATTSDYHSLQAQYKSRLSRGLQTLVNYTWSHAIDMASFDNDVSNTLARGNAAFDVRHNFSAAITYDLPKAGGEGAWGAFAKALANGWSVDSMFYAQSGKPLEISVGGTILPDGRIRTFYPDVVPGAPVWIKDPSVPGGQRINPAAFTHPPHVDLIPFPDFPDFIVRRYERQGNLGRNAIVSPGIYQLNMGVRRQFNLGERWNLQFKAEAFNLLNHPLFSGYGTIWDADPGFGVAQSTLSSSALSNSVAGLNSLYQIGGPRSMQLALRLSF